MSILIASRSRSNNPNAGSVRTEFLRYGCDGKRDRPRLDKIETVNHFIIFSKTSSPDRTANERQLITAIHQNAIQFSFEDGIAYHAARRSKYQ